jgi:prepilin-type N-terminal cleavage/methylation domain-containing protein
MKPRTRPDPQGDRGFTLIELLTVVGIIVILLAVSLPAILQYVRVYQVRGGAQQVQSLVQAARFKAIGRNVNLGVVFTVTSPTTAQWALEDDANPQVAHCNGGNWSTWANECGTRFDLLLADPIQASQTVLLPVGITFVTPQSCNVAPAAPNDWGLRFNRLGQSCGVSQTNCQKNNPLPPYALTGKLIYVDPTTGAAAMCVIDSRTQSGTPPKGLTEAILVNAGGRSEVQP